MCEDWTAQGVAVFKVLMDMFIRNLSPPVADPEPTALLTKRTLSRIS